jgi:hypothetical protein
VERFFILFFNRFITSSASIEREMEDGTLLAFNGNNLKNVQILNYTDGEWNYVLESSDDSSNGRLEVFFAYLKAISFSGHPGMSPKVEDGEDYAHAHNSYLQVFYNFGIIAGVMFLVICAVSLFKSAQMALSYGRKYSICFVPFAIIVAFGCISLTEWAFHPCIPAGFAFLFMQAVLIKDRA